MAKTGYREPIAAMMTSERLDYIRAAADDVPHSGIVHELLAHIDALGHDLHQALKNGKVAADRLSKARDELNALTTPVTDGEVAERCERATGPDAALDVIEHWLVLSVFVDCPSDGAMNVRVPGEVVLIQPIRRGVSDPDEPSWQNALVPMVAEKPPSEDAAGAEQILARAEAAARAAGKQ